uniref:Uncharacterized protein n=1 Tax=Molossus molossus TaxID=27622 RepID=A0A7J8FSA2_MOLMO|nr:hypothetical protein HJG59_008398 [Molossus molossus]
MTPKAALQTKVDKGTTAPPGIRRMWNQKAACLLGIHHSNCPALESCHFYRVPHLFFFFFILTRGHFSIFCSGRVGGRERNRERERNIDVKGTHRVAATRTTDQGRGQTATEVRALSGNRTRVSQDRRPML